jgi:hypothetical protein
MERLCDSNAARFIVMPPFLPVLSRALSTFRHEVDPADAVAAIEGDLISSYAALGIVELGPPL